MTGCCDPGGTEGIFNERRARRAARRYRRRGLGRTGRRIVALITEGGVEGATVLEIGGGVGEMQIELLRRGAARATNLELSSAYETHARELLADAGLGDRVERRIADIVAAPDDVGPADVVVLNRVVCCYPDYARLLAAAAEHARRQVVFSHPPRNVLSRSIFAMENLMLRLQGSTFRVFLHPPAAMRAVLAEHGLRPEPVRGGVWRIVAASR